ncbi:MAG: hypothetical protein KGL02_11360 [Acidobacteriota bacterium]|nr:hypothetical protein [Acidobacteriota bacterium]
MQGPVSYAIWMFVLLAECFFVVCALYRREFFRNLTLSSYMLLCLVGNVGVYVCSRAYGIHSAEYFYSYYSSDILLSVLMYFVIAGLFSQVFAGTQFSRYVRGASLILLGATALFAFISSYSAGQKISTQFAVELEQDLNFVGVVLMYVLWGAVTKLRESRLRLVQVILALGVYCSAVAATYALRNLFPNLEFSMLAWLPPITALWLPVAWSYTFMRVPESARFAPGHLLAAPQ